MHLWLNPLGSWGKSGCSQLLVWTEAQSGGHTWPGHWNVTSSGLSFKSRNALCSSLTRLAVWQKDMKNNTLHIFYSGFYPKRSHRASVTTMEPAFNEEEWQASIVSAHFHEGFFLSQSGSFFCLWWGGEGEKSCDWGGLYLCNSAGIPVRQK